MWYTTGERSSLQTMGILTRILIGFGLAAVGIFFTIRTRTIIDMFGNVDWADRNLGGGGTSLFYKFLGILVTLIGFVVATNMWDALLQGTIGRLFPEPPRRVQQVEE